MPDKKCASALRRSVWPKSPVVTEETLELGVSKNGRPKVVWSAKAPTEIQAVSLASEVGRLDAGRIYVWRLRGGAAIRQRNVLRLGDAGQRAFQ